MHAAIAIQDISATKLMDAIVVPACAQMSIRSATAMPNVSKWPASRDIFANAKLVLLGVEKFVEKIRTSTEFQTRPSVAVRGLAER